MAEPEAAAPNKPSPVAPLKSVARIKPKKPASRAPVEERPTRVLPTNRITFSKQLDMLRAYAAASGPAAKIVTNKEVAAILKVVESTARMANPFFVDCGLLQRNADGFLPSAEVLAFQRNHAWSAETASHKLAPAIARTWFGIALLPRLAVHPMTEDAVLTELGAMASATPDYKGQLRVLIDYLEAAGLIERVGAEIKLRQEGVAMSASPTTPEQPVPAAETPRETPLRTNVATAFLQPTEGAVQFHIQVKVDMKELGTWKNDRIAAFFTGIAQVLQAKADVEKEASSE